MVHATLDVSMFVKALKGAFATMQYSMLEMLPVNLILMVAALVDEIRGGYIDIAAATSTNKTRYGRKSARTFRGNFCRRQVYREIKYSMI